MKNKMKNIYALLAFIMILVVSCDKTGDSAEADALVLPPFESMAVDFGDFMEDPANMAKGNNLVSKVGSHWGSSRLVVGYWNTALFTSLAVPVASFKTAFKHDAERITDNKWQWTYTVEGFTGQYVARLTGELSGEEVIWEMFVTRTGIEGFDEFLWFSGVSARDGNSGEWTLYQDAEHPNSMINIEWERSNNEIASIRYTWVRELNDDDVADPYKNSYLEYGLQEGDFNVYYDIHVYNPEMEAFVDVDIEWNRTDYNGRVMAPAYYQDEAWHCWDSMGEDVDCE
tara:strand:- start:2905 stop:3759 length:855 start_codon:yes stop_codon:yes gene_type:complete